MLRQTPVVADPETLNGWRRAGGNVTAPSCFIANAPNKPFYTEKGDILQIKSETSREGRAPSMTPPQIRHFPTPNESEPI